MNVGNEMVAVISIFSITAVSAAETANTAESASAEENELSSALPIKIELDKSAYSSDESIKVSVTGTNKSPADLEKAQLKLLIPQGYELASGNLSESKDVLPVDQAIELKAELKKQALRVYLSAASKTNLIKF